METQSPTKHFILAIQHWIEDNASSEYRSLTTDTTSREDLGLEPRR